MKNGAAQPLWTVLRRAALFLLALCVAAGPAIAVRAGETVAQSEETAAQQQEAPGSEPPEGGPKREETAAQSGGDGAEDAPQEGTVSASVRLTKSKKAAYIRWKRVAGAYAYKVQRSSKRDGKFQTVAFLSQNDCTYRDKGVRRGRRYYYRVAAAMEDGGNCCSKTLALDCPLGKVSGVKLIRYSTTSIKVVWDADKNAKWYKVYYATTRNGKYKLAGTTKQNWFRVKKLANYHSYHFRVEACVSRKASALDSGPSQSVTMVTRPYERLTVFAGDSLTRGLKSYNAVDKIKIGGKKAVVAVDGLNTLTFRTKKVIGNRSAMDEVIRLTPYRVYIMLGGNDIHYLDKSKLIDRYRVILKAIRDGSPGTDIVLLAMSPVTAAAKQRLPGFSQIPAYNQDLSELAEELGMKFYDCTEFMKDSTGCLKSAYATADGIHWKAPVYDEYAKLLETYDKTLD